MKENIPAQLIDKYLNGNCSADEEIQLADWYNLFEHNQDPIFLLTGKQKEELKLKMLNEIRENVSLKREIQSNRFKYAYLYAAASIAVVGLIVFSLFEPAAQKIAVKPLNKVLASSIQFTNNSSRLNKYVLPDNSIVWLKPIATIKYERNFIKRHRSIELKGEAFFEVEKDPEHPFLIYSGGVVTRVLGTSFNIKTDEGANTTEVSVVTGKVFVYTPGTKSVHSKSVYLLPEQKATYLRVKNQLVKMSIKEPALTIWKKSSLSFDNIPVNDVIQTLNKSFDTRITVTDNEINQYTLKADFTDVNLPTIMELLSKSLNITYKLQGDRIMVSKKPETNVNN